MEGNTTEGQRYPFQKLAIRASQMARRTRSVSQATATRAMGETATMVSQVTWEPHRPATTSNTPPLSCHSS